MYEKKYYKKPKTKKNIFHLPSGFLENQHNLRFLTSKISPILGLQQDLLDSIHQIAANSTTQAAIV